MLQSTVLHVPPGQYPPFATVTDTDHRAWIIIAAALGLSLTLLSAVMRVFIRLTISRGWGSDDILLAGSIIFSWVQTSLVLVACSRGLGRSLHLIPSVAVDGIEKLYYGSSLLFPISLGLSKASVCLFLLRVTPVKHQRWALNCLIGGIAAWTVAALFTNALQCDLSRPWVIVGSKCSGWFVAHEILGIFASLFEVAIVLLALWIIWGIQTSVDKKLIIVLAFSFRLPMLIAVGFRLGSFDKAGYTINPTLLEASYICWTQTEMNYSIVSAIIPSATKLVKSLSTNYGVAFGVTSSGGYGPSSLASGNHNAATAASESIPLSSLKSIRQRMSATTSGRDEFRVLTSNEDMNYSYEIGSRLAPNSADRKQSQARSQPEDTVSVQSDESQKMIIRKDITYEVHDSSTA